MDLCIQLRTQRFVCLSCLILFSDLLLTAGTLFAQSNFSEIGGSNAYVSHQPQGGYVPSAPDAGVTVAGFPMINQYEAKKGTRYKGHKETLDTLTDAEAFSSLLSPDTDAQRDGDLTDPYYVPTQDMGHVLPEIMPFRRKLQQKGISFSVSYKGEVLGNFNGGMRKGADYISRMDYSVNLDLGKLFGFRNWSIHSVTMDKAGRQPSKDRVGEYNIPMEQSVGITGQKAFRLVDLYAEKNLFQNRLDIAFGRMTLTHIFAQSPLLCTFTTTCSAPAAIKADPGMSAYPKGTWGGRVKFRPTRDTHFIVGAFQVYPTAQDPGGWAWGSEKTTGIALPIEFEWTPFLTKDRLPGRYKFGFMHDSSNYADIFGNDLKALSSAWKSLGYSGHPSHSHKEGDRASMNTFWFEMEQMMYRLGGQDRMAGGYFLSGFIHNTPHISTIDDQAYGGFSLSGLIKGREKDRFGVLYSWYHVSNRKRLGELALMNDAGADDLATAMVLGDAYGTFGSLGNKVKGAQSSTHIIEAYYSIAVTSGIRVQPEFLYQIRPGETHHIPDSAMFGFRLLANL